MLSKPFAISELNDPSQVRVVFYSGGAFVHAPLNSVFDLLKSSLKTEIDGSLKDLEKRLESLSEEIEELKECLL
ncbi:hypothetical protein [Bartonella krasnovii]|uniref:Uncharacterized protein n=1 Tax=Bartonella krasnovii TaxID=2267275 RepID=A0A5B9D2R6_9HYPH|nr:hypothetical protein [Bartonella krasnovii]QEE12264.1 hypothetical protein D1092_04505 [Bartonella krasnovii]UNF29799.1 hypothetical protein MNL13_03310 [Bartonella krasnovii]UNF36159.1 hypothetical protein MNL12_03305 [Bartonella krasnovii]UNF37866.1 hypothetical protein MNL11_03835 [Bartonella krasnovii]UNF39639.1 hypothetical protein MNL10_04290 [Bartonella krasnovii]